MFWGLYHIDRDLIYPVENDYKTPALINHIQHTAVGIFVLVESFLQLHEVGSRAVNVTLLLTALSSYCGWILYLGESLPLPRLLHRLPVKTATETLQMR